MRNKVLVIAFAFCALNFVTSVEFAQAQTESSKPFAARATPIPISNVVGDSAVDPLEAPIDTEVKVEEKPTLRERAKEAASDIGRSVNESNYRRSQSPVTAMLAYSAIDLLLPSKLGLSVGWNRDATNTLELEYLSAKLSVPFVVDDLGSFTDRRVSLLKRSYQTRNSFNFHYGLSYFDTVIHVGNEYLSQTSGRPASVDLLSVKSLGLIWGVGNRWNFAHGFTLGVDWFSWAQPLVVVEKENALIDYANNQNVKDTLEDALSVATYFPRLTVLKLEVGYSF